MNRLKQSILLMSSMSLLCACASSETAKTAPGLYQFGSSVRSNIAAHSVEPDPDLKENTYIPADRERVRAAREAYRKGEVKELEPVESILTD